MSLQKGTRIGSYEIVGSLGQGGMGEVYRAKDFKLKREVAIKRLTGAVAQDPDRIARFEREAQVLASLNHPNIAAIYGLVEHEGGQCLVLELVEGRTLEERLQEGAFDVQEATAIGLQVIAALEAAHGKGIIHRDLKPANIKVGAQGQVKVLDFGLAKALAPQEAEADRQAASLSPTLTARMTQAGVLMGTAAYMSPEQARGRETDRRSDIWSLGCLLYEMITARQAFAGATVTDVLAAIITREPSWSGLPETTPPALRRVLRRCLQKDRTRRFHDVADVRLELEEAGVGEEADSEAEVSSGPARPVSRRRGLVPWLAAGVCAIVAAAALWRGAVPGPGVSPPTTFGVTVPAGMMLPDDELPILDISADGRTLVFVAVDGKGRRLYRRSLDRLKAEPIAGTDGAKGPFLSPDGRFVAFFSGNKLMKVPLEGGVPVALAETPANRGASWGPDGRIVLSTSFNTGLVRVPDIGGEAQVLTALDATRKERSHRWPQVLPGGRWVLFTVGVVDSPGDYDDAAIEAVRVETGERRRVLEGARMARYAAPGYLLFQRGSSLLAARFDPDRVELVGTASSLLEGVGGEKSSGAGYWAASGSGSLFYAPRSAISDERMLVVADREGQETRLPLPLRSYWHPRFAPDGKRIAFSIGTGAAAEDDVWVFDTATSRLDRLTFDSGNGVPCWSPDGRRVAFSRGGKGDTGIFWKPADSSGEAEMLFPTENGVVILPDAFLPDGEGLAVTEASGNLDILFARPGSAEPPGQLLDGPWAEWGAAFSPDGRFIAYTSTESGENEVFVRDFPALAGKWQVSKDGGMFPVWSHDGSELYYVKETTVLAVPVHARETAVQLGEPHELFSGPFELGTTPIRNFDVSPDGRFVLVRRRIDPAARRQITALLGWPGLLPEER